MPRSHGGAQIAAVSGVEIAFESPEQIKLLRKRANVAVAYGLLRPDSSVFPDAGTTLLQLARRLRLYPMPLRDFTNCLPVAQVLMSCPLSLSCIWAALHRENAPDQCADADPHRAAGGSA